MFGDSLIKYIYTITYKKKREDVKKEFRSIDDSIGGRKRIQPRALSGELEDRERVSDSNGAPQEVAAW